MSLSLFAALLSSSPALAGGELPVVAEAGAEEGALEAWGQLQVWTTLVDQDGNRIADPASYGDPEQDPGFSIPRGRLGLTGRVPTGTEDLQTRWALSVGVGTPYDALSPADTDVQLVDGWGQVLLAESLGSTSATLGYQKVAFGREQLISSADLLFMERAIPSEWISPGRGVGATLAQAFDVGDSGMAALRLGAFNGNQSLLGDDDPGLLLSARGELALGEAYQTWSQDLDSALGVGVSYLNNAEISTSTNALGADLLARVKGFTLLGEVSQAGIAPADTTVAAPAVSDPTRQLGLVGQLSFFAPTSDHGGLEIGARWASFDDDARLEDNGDVQVLHAGLTWRDALPRLDVGGGYIHRVEVHGRDLPNDTVRLWVQLRPSWMFDGA